jgi:hypothetical protein
VVLLALTHADVGVAQAQCSIVQQFPFDNMLPITQGKESSLSSSSSRWRKAIVASNCCGAMGYSISSIRTIMDLVIIN